MMNVLIVDDEAHARHRLHDMLQGIDGIGTITQCKNGIEAIHKIEENNLDLLFLDIEMPEVNGFDVLQHFDVEHLPQIIFVTAYSEYAVKAFEVNAIDYLHKPFDKERLKKAVEKTQAVLKNKRLKGVQENLNFFLNNTDFLNDSIKRLIIKTGDNIYIVKTENIQWIEAAGNYVNIVTEEKKHLLRSTLSGLKERLNDKEFYQIHRSTIVNINYVERVEEWQFGDYKVIMSKGEKLKMSRHYTELIKNF